MRITFHYFYTYVFAILNISGCSKKEQPPAPPAPPVEENSFTRFEFHV
jgi:hypothetical protein